MLIHRISIYTKVALLLSLFSVLSILFFFLNLFENRMQLISENESYRTQVAAIKLRRYLEAAASDQNITQQQLTDNLRRAMISFQVSRLDLINKNKKLVLSLVPRGTPAPLNLEGKIGYLITKTLFKSEFEDKLFHQEFYPEQRKMVVYVPFNELQGGGVLRMATHLHRFSDVQNELNRRAILGAIVILAIYLGALLFFIVRLILKPIRHLSRVTHDIANGNLEVRVDITRRDEIGSLANDFNEMAVAIQKLTNRARNANPLTGLPGNNEIVDEIERRLKNGDKFAVLYCDLDNFKAYNDKYGFLRGDDVLLYSRDVFTEAVRTLNLDSAFVGHEGGDDFVLVVDAEDYPRLAETIIKLYNRNVRQFYNSKDQKTGYIEAYNREGELRRFRFVSVSIGIVTNEEVSFSSYPEIISVAAEVKKHAKEISGSSYSVNRRKTL